MNILIVFGALVVWIVCGLIAAPYERAFWWHYMPVLQNNGERKAEVNSRAVFTLCFGPIGLIGSYFMTSGFYYGRMTRKQLMEARPANEKAYS